MVFVMVEGAVAMTEVGGWERQWCGLWGGIERPQEDEKRREDEKKMGLL